MLRNYFIWACSFIFSSAPYLSVEKLRIDSLTTVLYDRQRFCQTVGLTVAQLPLLACLLGNDVVSQEKMQHIRNDAMAAYRCVEFSFVVSVSVNVDYIQLKHKHWMHPLIIIYDSKQT